MAVKALFGEQQGRPSSLNVPLVALLDTTVEYFVLVRMAHAVTCAQHRFVRGYSSVPSPMVITTGATMVVSAGMVWATTMQYLHPSA